MFFPKLPDLLKQKKQEVFFSRENFLYNFPLFVIAFLDSIVQIAGKRAFFFKVLNFAKALYLCPCSRAYDMDEGAVTEGAVIKKNL